MSSARPLSALGSLPALPIDEMEALARAMAKRLLPGDALCLCGDIGAGKTSFARTLIQSIAHGVPEVASPTFTLMQQYDVTLGNQATETLWHLDLYRLESFEQLEALGLEELWPHLVVMEWPELALPVLPASRLEIAFDFGASQEVRTLIFQGNDAWRERLAGLI